MTKVQFYPVDITYKIINNKPVIFLYGKTTSERRICVIDRNFSPYFYIIPDKGISDALIDAVARIRTGKEGTVYNVTKTEIVKKNLFGKEVDAIKVYVNLPQGVSVLSEQAKQIKDISVYENDILFTRHYLIDNEIIPMTLLEMEGEYINMKSRVSVFSLDRIVERLPGTLTEPKILAFDIETYNPLGRESSEKNPIIMAAFYGKDFHKVITWKKFKTNLDYIEFVDDEKTLLQRFKEILKDIKPDILAGYFSDEFDIPYIVARSEKNNVEMDIGLDYSKPRITGRNVKSRIKGISHIDVHKFVKNIISRALETESYSLASVSAELLKERKEEIDLDLLADIWDNKPGKLQKFCTYNLNDATLTFKLAENILPIMTELAKITGLPFFDISRTGFSKLVEWYLIRNTHSFNEIIPNSPTYKEIAERKKQTFKGGLVFEPKPGLYKDIIVFDYRSLYPSIISSHNIGISTINCHCCKDISKPSPTEEKYWFCTKRKGFLPSLIEELVTRRMRVKEMLKDKKSELMRAREESLKLLANSFYGYLSFFGSRWYSLELAKSVTAYGRYYIRKVINLAKKENFNVIYSDTDSVFLTLGRKTIEDTKKFSEMVNMELPGLMELDYEGFYKRGIFVSAKEGRQGAKKKYALISDKGIKIKGFETVRRNVSVIAKEVQRNVLEMVLKEGNAEKALGYVKESVIKLMEKKIPTEKVLISTQLTKKIEDYRTVASHVAVAKRLKQLGVDVGPGSLIKYLIVEGKGRISDRARLLQEVEKGEYDAQYYINNQILPSVEPIFNVLGIKKDELSDLKQQSKLKKFF